MKKWFFVLVLVAGAVPFAAGLRIDFKVLADKLQKKSDYNVQSLVKMGIDPNEVGLQEKPWWTFKPEDNLFKRITLPKKIDLGPMDIIKAGIEDPLQTLKETKQKLGPDLQQSVMNREQALYDQARLKKQEIDKRMRETENS